MGFLERSAVDDVMALVQVEEPRGFLRRILQIVIHGDRNRIPGQANPAQERVVLTEIPHQVESPDPGVLRRQFPNDPPAFVPAAVVHQNYFERTTSPERGRDPGDRRPQRGFGVIHRKDNRDRHASAPPGRPRFRLMSSDVLYYRLAAQKP